jgi:hypothetical protein
MSSQNPAFGSEFRFPLDVLERKLEKLGRGRYLDFTETGSAEVLSFVIWAVAAVLMKVAGHGVLATYTLAFGLCFALAFGIYMIWLERSLTRRIATSGLGHRLITEPRELAEIYRAAPIGLVPFVLRNPPASLEGWLITVADNLDWFLKPRGKLLRASWVLWPLLISMAIAATVVEGSLLPLLLLVMPVLIPVLCLMRRRQAVFTRVLLTHLRESTTL